MIEAADSSVDDASEGRASLVGTLIGDRYRIESMVGTGGMGTVYRVEHVHMRKTLALKVLHRELLVIEEIVARFEREAIAAARIEHPNVAKATDFGRLDDGSFYLVMEFVSGQSLGELLRGGALPVARAVHIALQIAGAIDAAHQAGIVHRDLKPDNVLLLEQDGDLDSVKVLDFGIAKVEMSDAGGSSKLTRAGAVFGTPEYMAPEQAAGSAVDHRADLYALGVMLYEMLTGKTPFDDDDVVTLLTRQLTEPPPALPDAIPLRLRELVMKLLAKDPAERPASAHEVMLLLLELEQELVTAANQAALKAALATTVLALEVPKPPRTLDRRKLLAVASISAGVVVLLVAGVIAALGRDEPVPPPLLGSGAFDVRLPRVQKPAPKAVRPEPSATPAATAEKSGTRKATTGKKKPAEKKKNTGPGGIYIPPPSEWF